MMSLREAPLQGHGFLSIQGPVVEKSSAYWYTLGECEEKGWSMNESVWASDSLKLHASIFFYHYNL